VHEKTLKSPVNHGSMMILERELIQNKKNVDAELELFFSKLKKQHPFLKRMYAELSAVVLGGGKRLRPLLLSKAYASFAGRDENICRAALCVELLHNSTLIQDDVMDEDELRRNKPTIYKQMREYYLGSYPDDRANFFSSKSSRFAASQAICAANTLYSLGLSCLDLPSFKKEHRLKAMSLYADALRTLNEGQMLDIESEKSEPKEADYFTLAQKKTGTLFEYSVRVGAALAGYTGEDVQVLANYARFVAIAFQLQDDILDLTHRKGNTFGSDIRAGKRTLLMIKAIQHEPRLITLFGKKDATDAEIEHIVRVMNEHACPYVQKLARSYIQTAKDELEKLHPKEISFFNDLAEYAVKRRN
jgi:geranylgeranyl diphosphate synthase, type I